VKTKTKSKTQSQQLRAVFMAKRSKATKAVNHLLRESKAGVGVGGRAKNLCWLSTDHLVELADAINRQMTGRWRMTDLELMLGAWGSLNTLTPAELRYRKAEAIPVAELLRNKLAKKTNAI
jgi:hypothetical protein